MCTPNIITHSLIEIRHYLHQYPELSGQETQTAKFIAKQLETLNPTHIYQGIAGTGVAAVFDSSQAGKTLLFRCELDALPIQEIHTEPYISNYKGISHQCGHDGHMTIILGLAKYIAENPPQKGRVVLLFQPAEETGEGARQVVVDEQFAMIKPDESYALHNLPSYPLGEVIIKEGAFNCASRGMIIRLKGRTAHAAYPETGISPQLALAEILQAFNQLPEQLMKAQVSSSKLSNSKIKSSKLSSSEIQSPELNMITVVHCQMGEQAFGTAPADGCVMATLRTESNEGMADLVTACEKLAEQTADKYQLELTIEWSDIFDASVNDAGCVQQIIDATTKTGNQLRLLDEPFRWSEDFGAISAVSKGAMFAFGAGESCPQIHNPDYLFDDALIEQGINIFFEVYRQLL